MPNYFPPVSLVAIVVATRPVSTELTIPAGLLALVPSAMVTYIFLPVSAEVWTSATVSSVPSFSMVSSSAAATSASLLNLFAPTAVRQSSPKPVIANYQLSPAESAPLFSLPRGYVTAFLRERRGRRDTKIVKIDEAFIARDKRVLGLR